MKVKGFIYIFFVLLTLTCFEIFGDEVAIDAPIDLNSILRKGKVANAQIEAPVQDTQAELRLYALPEPESKVAMQDGLDNKPAEGTHPQQEGTLAQNESPIAQGPAPAPGQAEKSVLINFNNVSIIEYIRFVSRITGRNFVFDDNDLQFNVTIISEEPATIDNIMTALLQVLHIHDLNMFEEGNNLVIHKNPKVSAISRVVTDNIGSLPARDTDLVTQVFRLNTLDVDKASVLLRPLTSDFALIESLKDTNTLIITDLAANIERILFLLRSIDGPNGGLVIGQYVSRLTPLDTLIPLAQQILLPISLDQPLNFVAQAATNSVFVISTPFLVERALAILEFLDMDQGATRILNLKDLRLGGIPIHPRAGAPAAPNQLLTPGGRWLQDQNGNWFFKPENPMAPPRGGWVRDNEGRWDFVPGGPPGTAPRGRWVQEPDGSWRFELDETEPFNPGELLRQARGIARLPGGLEKRTKFFIYKLRYRKGDTIERVLRQIADTLQQNERGNEDLIAALRSVQWLEATNSVVFSGTVEALDKAYALVRELDLPMRQVFVEVLILDTSIIDSLNYGVTFGSRFAGGDVAGAQSFFSGATPLLGALTTAGLTNLGTPVGNQQVLVPDPTGLATDSTAGFNIGIIGQKITHCGTEFGSIAALVNTVHDRTNDRVVMNPKILIENNTPAELFVGINTPFRTQSISNDRGTVLTSNFDYRDIGTTLKITPYLGHSDIVVMDIYQEDSTIIAGLITNANTANTSPGPTTRVNRTKTRVHVPSKYFLVISGMLQHEEARERNQVPCLGGVPILGAGFSNKDNKDTKRNLLMFLRPVIVDTEEEIQWITKHQQDVYDYKNCLIQYDEYEWQEALDLFNINKTLHPEDDHECECY